MFGSFVTAALRGAEDSLSMEEKQNRDLFQAFDRSASGRLTAFELRSALEHRNLCPTDADIESIISSSATKKSVDLLEFRKAIKYVQERTRVPESELLSAWIACGGNASGQGQINADHVQKILRDEFGMAIKFDDADSVDADNKHHVTFEKSVYTTLLRPEY